MQLFYNADLNSDDKQIQFSKDESRHIIKVLRKTAGDQLFITNGHGILFTAVITIPDLKKCVATIISKEKKAARPYKLHMVVAPTKSNDRYEWFLEKATELGVDEITPIICKNSERKIIKPDRFEKIIMSAMKQSLSCYLPRLNTTIPFSSFIEQSISGQKFIAHCEDGKKSAFKSKITPGSAVTILIGPEGDFNSAEIAHAIQQSFIPVSLGTSRLRTETAAIAACHTAALVNEV